MPRRPEPAPLPIDPLLPALRDAVARGHVVLHAPTGAGKTTRVPPALLGDTSGRILVLEPRRVAARAAAARMAAEHGERVGETFGHHVRFDRRVGPGTRVIVATEGIVLRRLVSDPLLEDVDVLVFDELHERSLDADLALGIARQVAEARGDLRIVAMSATLDTDRVADFLGAPVLASEGRTFPVEVRWLDRPDPRPVHEQIADHLPRLLAAHDGDALVFLPGVGEIRRCAAALDGRLAGVDVVPLHGRLPPAEQDRALQDGPRRRVVLSTNVAETSVTVPGVRLVVDSGLVRRVRHDAGTGLDRLRLEGVSQASADQRAGRAGRTAPGVCLRLWTHASHDRRPAHDPPEVRRADLAAPLLSLLAWGEPDVRAFPWLDAPPEHAVGSALDLLERLGATRDGALTGRGEALARLPVHPRLGAFLLEASARGVQGLASDAAALLSEGGLRRDRARPSTPADVLEDLDQLERQGPRGLAHRVRQVATQLRDALPRGAAPSESPARALGRAALAGWPDRVAWRRQPGAPDLLLANGRGARLHADSGVRDAPFLVALDVDDRDGDDALVRSAVAIDPGWLDAAEALDVRYDADRDRVVGARERRWGALVLHRQEGVPVPDGAVVEALRQAARAHPSRVIPDARDDRRLLARLRFVARARPDLDLPDEDTILAALLPGRRSLAEVARAAWTPTILGLLPWPARQALDREAPDTLQVPSGSNVRLDYPDEGPPVLAVRMQELFGLADTPRVGGAPVLLHLLAPNRRPQQVTDDLAGFWARAWPEVRKDLRGRYPKHAWPEDPLAAEPLRGTKRRGRS